MITELLIRLIPTYGNWGGPGWSSGRYEDNPDETDWSVPPRDSLDALFKEHDRAYQEAIKTLPKYQLEGPFDEADRVLVREAKKLSWNPYRWELPPKTASWGYAFLYRRMVIRIFTIKGKL